MARYRVGIQIGEWTHELLVKARNPDAARKEILRRFSITGDAPILWLQIKYIKRLTFGGKRYLFTKAHQVNYIDMLLRIIKSGASITSIAQVIRSHRRHELFSPVIRAIIFTSDVVSNLGGTYSQCMAALGFSDYHVSLVHHAEQTGSLEDTLTFLRNIIDEDIRTRRQIRREMLEPVIVILMAALVSLLIRNKLIPKMEEIYRELQASMPFYAYFASDFGGLIFPLVVAFAMVLFAIRERILRMLPDRLALQLDRFICELPIVGKVLVYQDLSIAFSVLLQEVKSTGRISSGCEAAARTCMTLTFRNLFERAAHYIAEQPIDENSERTHRYSLGTFLLDESLVPSEIPAILRVAEESGTLEEAIERIHQNINDLKISALTQLKVALITTVLLVVGLTVGLTVAGIYIPLYDIINRI